jgi:hypothetical protein
MGWGSGLISVGSWISLSFRRGAVRCHHLAENVDQGRQKVPSRLHLYAHYETS